MRTFWFENKEDTLKQKWIVFYADASIRSVHMISKRINEITYIAKGAFKYYVIKEVGGWVGQMMMFDDKVGGWEWLNDDVIKK